MKERVATNSQDSFLKIDGGKSKSNAIDIPTINLPRGGGAIRGIDEKFSVNTVNGTSSFSIPLPFSPARGVVPSLLLSYNSGSGNGIFGLGWSLEIPSIKRKTDKGLPQYLDSIESDTFIFSGTEDLVPEFRKEADGSFSTDSQNEYIINERDTGDGLYKIRNYKPRIESLFARIERWTEISSGLIKWRVITRSNITTLFGWNSNSVIADPDDNLRIFEWLPDFVFDDKGNCARYYYKKEDDKGADNSRLHNRNRIENGIITYAGIYPEKIVYGNKSPYKRFGDEFPEDDDFLFSSIFDYGEYELNSPFNKTGEWSFRNDAFSDYRAGFEIRTTRLCRRILFFHHFRELNEYDGLVKSLDLNYSDENDFSFLTSVTSCGYIKKPDGDYSNKKLPPVEFEYQKHEWNGEIKNIASDDIVHLPAGLNDNYQFTDLYNEGLSGILTEQAGGWYYKSNLGDGKFEPAKLVSPKPSFMGLGSRLYLADLDADGGKQIVSMLSEPKGYFELDDENEWQVFRNFRTMPGLDLDEPSARMLDLNGDGKPEIVITEDHVFTWYLSEGRNGFSQSRNAVKPFDEEAGPYMVFNDGNKSICLADMNGDGLTDIVRIRNGEVCYWPNMGYGKFGRKVAMDRAPVFDSPDSFNAASVRLADIDGSGTSDIIYLGKNKFSCWINLSGNAFKASPFEIVSFPEIHNNSVVTVADLLGNGVSCIVWSDMLPKHSSNPLRYIDLMNSRKPHTMTSYKNNTGKEVYLEYKASTRFYLEDKLAGKPWVTKLHFPVHCISKTRTLDKITGIEFTSEYKYHHGYYDHAEREFRGFGMVEQIDTETYKHWSKGTASNIVDATLHQAPVITKSWNHTGAFLNGYKILTKFSEEFWYEEFRKQGFPVTHHEVMLSDTLLVSAPGIPDTVIEHLSAEVWNQAIRACKGMNIRTEVFSQDSLPLDSTIEEVMKQLSPYSVTAQNCMIELLQPKGSNRFAVFSVKTSESVSYSYERDIDDPRIAHKLNVRMDEYGNVLESASIAYPRFLADNSLPSETQEAQKKTLIVYTQNRYTNDVIDENTYRLRLPSEAVTFELREIPKNGQFYTVSDFENILITANEVPYNSLESTPGLIEKRVIEQVRTVYYRNDLSGPLGLHQLESVALPFESYQLAYTQEMVADIYGIRVDDAVLTEGGFSHNENDSNWWVRSVITQFKENSETHTDAKNRFYTPVSFTDPFGAKTKVKFYGNYFLFLEEIEDALGNKTKVEQMNFRTLSPQRLRDINNNLSEALQDECGLLKALAIYGKGDEADDLSGITEFTVDEESDLIHEFLNSPETPEGVTDSILMDTKAKLLLQHSTMRMVYDLDCYTQTGKPNVVASIFREEHFQKNADSPVQISFEYSGGLGQVIMKKSQAEPGVAKKVILNSDDNYSVSIIDTSSLSTGLLRWIGNGRTILNNKGNAVKQYEPYFSATHRFEDQKELVETGVTQVMYYDAPGRLIKAEIPNGTFTRTEFDSWTKKNYDANDTVLESEWYNKRFNRLIDNELLGEGKDPAREKAAAGKAAFHANTPHTLHFDTLGRTVLSIEQNVRNGNSEFYRTKLKLDIEGNLRSLKDAREIPENNNQGNVVMQYKYDMLGNLVFQKSMDTGQRWMLPDILGNPLRTWDERNHEFQYSYDITRRPVQSKVSGGDGAGLSHVFNRLFYGEAEPDAELKNVRGRVIRHYDTAGLLETPAYDFKGLAPMVRQKLFMHYKSLANWTDANLLNDLESKEYIVSAEYDALGRLTRQTAPDGSITAHRYNEAGLLNSEIVIHANPSLTITYIKNIDYNERGQRSRVIYGNDVSTRFYYDKETFGLIRLESRRQNNDPLQDWNYTFDPIGNITYIEDKSIPIVFFDNQKITGVSEYTYDSLYRLIEATGRENDGALNFDKQDNWHDESFMKDLNPGDPIAMRNYTQSYQYDEAGNILMMRHQANGNNWTRNYEYEKTSNRLNTTKVGSEIYNYAHHPQHGFISIMPNLQEMEWNFREELVKSIRQKVNPVNGTAETTYYQYDNKGQRIRKLTENSALPGITPTKKDERIYLGSFETYRKYQSNTISFERETLSLMDEGRRFVIVETVKQNTIANPPPSESVGARLTRYQFQNYIGSASLELDDTAQVISYEEYHPFGSTAYQAKSKIIKAAAKRYRYTGMERDDETGLEYHSARYYITWLGRWLSPDPKFIADGVNFYSYTRNNPLIYTDTKGLETKQQRWEKKFDKEIPQYKNIDVTIGTFDEGQMTASGVRVPIYQGNYLFPRPFYEREKAAKAAYQGFIHYAELLEAGHDAAALKLSCSRYRNCAPIPDADLDMAAYANWSYKAKAASDGIQLFLMIYSLHGITSAWLARRAVTQAALKRAISTQSNVQNVKGVTRTVTPATGKERFSHTTASSRDPDLAAAQIIESKGINMSKEGRYGQWGEGAYAYEKKIGPGATQVEFSVPKGTAVERIQVPGKETIIRLVPAEGNVVKIVNPTTNLDPADLKKF
jgi:RHS repeat-associated protein